MTLPWPVEELHAAAREAVAQAIDELGLGNRKQLRGSKREAVEERALEILRVTLPAPPQKEQP